MIALIDYGAGNVRSVHKALVAVGADVVRTQSPERVLEADKVVLPGVGAFADCMTSLERLGLIHSIRAVVARGVPFLGICVGMQVLFDHGDELGGYDGLGLLPGQVVRFAVDSPLKVPHTGWNQIEPVPGRAGALLAGISKGAWAYFNHAYRCEARAADTLAVTDYGGPYASAVGRGQLYGVQFHPEKSQDVGLHILQNFVERVGLPESADRNEAKGARDE
jgi:imidazole glycerol-phosphate synthase subunit HisH